MRYADLDKDMKKNLLIASLIILVVVVICFIKIVHMILAILFGLAFGFLVYDLYIRKK